MNPWLTEALITKINHVVNVIDSLSPYHDLSGSELKDLLLNGDIDVSVVTVYDVDRAFSNIRSLPVIHLALGVMSYLTQSMLSQEVAKDVLVTLNEWKNPSVHIITIRTFLQRYVVPI